MALTILFLFILLVIALYIRGMLDPEVPGIIKVFESTFMIPIIFVLIHTWATTP